VTVPSSLRAVATAFDALFAVDHLSPFIVRRSTVSRAIAALLGVPWSPQLGQRVTAIVMAAGGRASVLRVPVYIWVRARALERQDAILRSLALRKRLRTTPADPALLAEARRVIGNA
jgi:hypothetical protein